MAKAVKEKPQIKRSPVKQKQAKDYSLTKDFALGLWNENPTFRQVLGLCPTLAVTVSVVNGFSMGMATLFVVVMASTTVSIIKKLIPHQIRLAGYVVIIASYVTIADLFLAGNFPEISKALGPYVPLIVVNCLILARSESFAARNPVHRSIADAFGMGFGFVWALLLLSSIREILGNGTLLGYTVLGSHFEPMIIMILPPGAFITLGIVLGLMNHFSKGEHTKETACH